MQPPIRPYLHRTAKNIKGAISSEKGTHTLPLNIWKDVFDHCSLKTLLNLSMVSRGFYFDLLDNKYFMEDRHFDSHLHKPNNVRNVIFASIQRDGCEECGCVAKEPVRHHLHARLQLCGACFQSEDYRYIDVNNAKERYKLNSDDILTLRLDDKEWRGTYWERDIKRYVQAKYSNQNAIFDHASEHEYNESEQQTVLARSSQYETRRKWIVGLFPALSELFCLLKEPIYCYQYPVMPSLMDAFRESLVAFKRPTSQEIKTLNDRWVNGKVLWEKAIELAIDYPDVRLRQSWRAYESWCTATEHDARQPYYVLLRDRLLDRDLDLEIRLAYIRSYSPTLPSKVSHVLDSKKSWMYQSLYNCAREFRYELPDKRAMERFEHRYDGLTRQFAKIVDHLAGGEIEPVHWQWLVDDWYGIYATSNLSETEVLEAMRLLHLPSYICSAETDSRIINEGSAVLLIRVTNILKNGYLRKTAAGDYASILRSPRTSQRDREYAIIKLNESYDWAHTLLKIFQQCIQLHPDLDQNPSGKPWTSICYRTTSTSVDEICSTLRKYVRE